MVSQAPDRRPIRILLIGPHGIGNLLMANPAIQALAESEQYELHIACTLSTTEAMCRHLEPFKARFTRVWALHLAQGMAHFLKTLFQIRRQRFDISIVLFPSASCKYNLMSRLLGARKRVGSSYPHQPWNQMAWLNTQCIAVVPELHDVVQTLRLCAEATERSLSTATDYRFPSPPKQPHLIGIHAGCKRQYSYKQWPVEQFVHTCKDILDVHPTSRFRFFFGPDEQVQRDQVMACLQDSTCSQLRERVEFPAKLSMIQLFHSIGECESFIANDSGLMHIASASGSKTLGIIGPSDERRTGPFGPKSSIIEHPIDCRPCTHTNDPRRFGFRCQHPEMYCLTRITPQEVVAAWLRLQRSDHTR